MPPAPWLSRLRRHELRHARIGIYSCGRFGRPHQAHTMSKLLKLLATARDQKARLRVKGRGPSTNHRDKTLKRFIVIFWTCGEDSQLTLSRCSLRRKPKSAPPSNAVNHGRSCCGKSLPATRVRWAEPVLFLRRGLTPKRSSTRPELRATARRQRRQSPRSA